jgi:hypothetical protein
MSKVDRVGERNINNFGSEMIIVEYKNAHDMDVYFPEYNWTFKHTGYNKFKKGNIKCPYEKRCYNTGYLGEGEYKTKENGKLTRVYRVWYHMLTRCYDPKYHEKYPTYINCEVCEEWHNYTNFGDWFVDNYYEVKNEIMCLDKDILNKGNKVYSPENCVFVPQNINMLFVKCDKNRGDYPIGVSYNKRDKKFEAQCGVYNFEENKKKPKFLGYYETPEKAFKAYKQFKENYIKEVAEYYKEQIPQKLYDALYNYEVDMND